MTKKKPATSKDVIVVPIPPMILDMHSAINLSAD